MNPIASDFYLNANFYLISDIISTKSNNLMHKCLEQLKKQVETSHSYLSKEATYVNTRLFVVKQALGRDIQSNLE